MRQPEFYPTVNTEVSVVGKVALGQVCLNVYFIFVYFAHYNFTKKHQSSEAGTTTIKATIQATRPVPIPTTEQSIADIAKTHVKRSYNKSK